MAGCARPTPDFSGVWKQSNERWTPKRSGDVTLKIEHGADGDELHLKASVERFRTDVLTKIALCCEVHHDRLSRANSD